MVLCLLGSLGSSETTHGQNAQRLAPPNETAKGAADARRDIAKGLIKYEIIGKPSMSYAELKRLAAERYHVTIVFHGCIVGPRVDYDQAYLKVVIAHLNAQYGFDPVAKILAELRD
ncbi:MAG: hypothetical protein OJI67_18175 [Prosthecobacter sp.]|nr:hypothetical protein [Prosthecobacter sp.]